MPDLGDEYARGRMIVQTVCTGCYGAAMDGIGEPAGDIQDAVEFDDAHTKARARRRME